MSRFACTLSRWHRKSPELSALVTTCSACTYLLKVVYPQHGVPLQPKVLHLSELLVPT